jgi:hypothetical protein
MMAQPMMAQPMMAQPMMAQPMMAQPMSMGMTTSMPMSTGMTGGYVGGNMFGAQALGTTGFGSFGGM